MKNLPKDSSKAARFLVLLIAFAIVTGSPLKAKAEPMREFVLSCSYGVLAGTLVGAASLAFTDRPGDNLNRVARGASLGLYTGILLGLYVVYGVPTEDDAMVAANIEGAGSERRLQVHMPPPPRVAVLPLVGERGFEGGALQVNIINF